MENNKILNIIDPVLKYIDSGAFFRQPFKWLYILFGVLNITIPISFISIISDGWRYMNGSTRFAAILIILISIALAYICFLIWFKRSQTLKLDAGESSRFIAIPVVANMLQTIGEWMVILIGVGGFAIVLIALIFAGDELRYVIGARINFVSLLVCPIFGYIIVVFSRFLAENCLALASIANSTKSIDKKIGKGDEQIFIETEE